MTISEAEEARDKQDDVVELFKLVLAVGDAILKRTPEMLPVAIVPFDDVDDELTNAVIRLPLKLREVILLHYFQGMKVNDIAEALGISQSSVSGRLKRGRDRLKDYLEGSEQDE